MLEVNDIRGGLIAYLKGLGEGRVVWCMRDFTAGTAPWSSAGQRLEHLVSRHFQNKKIDLDLIKDILGDDADRILELRPFHRQEKEMTPEHIKTVLVEFIKILRPWPWNTSVARKMLRGQWAVQAMHAHNALQYLQRGEPGVSMDQN